MARAPTHPGAILREDVLPALGISVSQAARDLGISRQMLHRILAEEASVTLKFDHTFGFTAGVKLLDPSAASRTSLRMWAFSLAANS